MNDNRIEIIRALVELTYPLDMIASRIREFDWDYEGDPVELTRSHVINLLKRYLKKEFAVCDVEHWANLLEGREDVCFESGSESVLDEIIYQLANPDLTVALNDDIANTLIGDLSK